MTAKQLLKVLFGLLNRGTARAEDSSLFENMPHDELVEKFAAYLNTHRHYLGYCQIEQSHALNDKGVDILLTAEAGKVGFQLKSHFDVGEKAFAANVKRQWAESHSHGLDHYFILICSPLADGGDDYSQKISHLLNELSQMKTNYHTALGPRNAVQFFRGLPPVSRNDLLFQKAIDDDCLHEHEKGYEHLPELKDADIVEVERHLDSFGEDWPDFDEGQQAFERLQKLVQAKEAEQFLTKFLPSLPPDIRRKREELVSEAQNLLSECRECKSWRAKSESKLPQWLDNVPEEMIPYTSLPNLLRIKTDLRRYLEIHRKMDTEATETAKETHEGREPKAEG
jgi:hypothetical protein